jgi:hypothetical protein
MELPPHRPASSNCTHVGRPFSSGFPRHLAPYSTGFNRFWGRVRTPEHHRPMVSTEKISTYRLLSVRTSGTSSTLKPR